MTYRINKTDGNQLVDIPDGTFDTSATSLTLIGKNVTNFGEAINENFVKMLENFASSSAPEQAILGQMWYDTSTGRLNVYDGTTFRAAGGPLVTPNVPTDLITGDLWINNETNQMYMFDGTDLILVGPSFTNQQGTSGFIVETVLDTFNRSQVIVKLYVSNTLIGIFSKSQFTPAQPIVGYSENNGLRVVNVGFNDGSNSSIKFDVTVTRADSILTDTGDTKTAGQILYNDEDGTLVGGLTIQSDSGLTIGATEDVLQKIETGKFVIEHQNTGNDIGIRVKTPTGTAEAITIDAQNSRVGIFNEYPQKTVDIGGDLKVAGDIIVGGTTVTINATTLQIQDINIELGIGDGNETDTTADGGGISLHGDTVKSINWVKQSPTSASNWTSSENFDLLDGKEYKINNVSVLASDTLGAGVINSSLTSLGLMTEVQMANGANNGLNITENTIQVPLGDIVINPLNGTLDLSGRRISNVATPTDVADATTKLYVDEAVFRRGIAMSMDVTGLTSNLDIAAILDEVAPWYDPVMAPTGVAVNGTRLRLHCTTTSVTNDNITYSPTENVEFTRITVTTPSGTDSAVRDISAGQTITAPGATVTVARQNKLFIMTAGAWVFSTNF